MLSPDPCRRYKIDLEKAGVESTSEQKVQPIQMVPVEEFFEDEDEDLEEDFAEEDEKEEEEDRAIIIDELKAEAQADVYVPKSTSWGVFPRPRNISQVL